MFGFTRKTDYALVALATLAQQGASRQTPASARQIALQHGLPLPLLMQLLKALHRAGILCSARGAGGGYYLAHAPKRITLVTVIEAIEGPLRVAPCCEDLAEAEPCVACRLIQTCPITVTIQTLNELVVGQLGRISIQDLIESQDNSDLLRQKLGLAADPIPHPAQTT